MEETITEIYSENILKEDQDEIAKTNQVIISDNTEKIEDIQ